MREAIEMSCSKLGLQGFIKICLKILAMKFSKRHPNSEE